MNNRDIIKSIDNIMLCIQALIKMRFNKRTKIIYSKGRYRSAHISFCKNPYVWRFYCEDQVSHYMLYLLKDDRIIRKDFIKKEELVNQFYTKLNYFFRYI